jgi:tetratricopeptide (TPR) repeat protein
MSLALPDSPEFNSPAPSQSQSPPAALPPAQSESSAPAAVDPVPTPETDPSRRRWDWLIFIGLAALLYYFLAVWYRWLRLDSDFLDFVNQVVGLLAIASLLGLQTERGSKLAIRIDDTFGLGRFLNSPRRICAVIWLAAGVFALILYVGSPQAGRFYRHQGLAALDAGHYSLASRKFQQAVNQVPKDARTHYDLASAYEALHDYEQAIAEYQIALDLDDEFWPVYNNLGRLLMQTEDDADAALAMLLAGQRRADDPLGQAVIGKNIARAYLEKELPRASLSTLEGVRHNLKTLQDQGLSVEIYLAETYQLAALAHEALEQPTEARRAWQDSLGYALAVAESEACTASELRPPPDCLDAISWVAEAREQLAEEKGSP